MARMNNVTVMATRRITYTFGSNNLQGLFYKSNDSNSTEGLFESGFMAAPWYKAMVPTALIGCLSPDL